MRNKKPGRCEKPKRAVHELHELHEEKTTMERQASPYPNTERQASRLLKPGGLFYPGVGR